MAIFQPAGTELLPVRTCRGLHGSRLLIAEFGATALAGLGARLVDDGVLEEDEDDTLQPEIEALIEHFGADTLAEDFMRYDESIQHSGWLPPVFKP